MDTSIVGLEKFNDLLNKVVTDIAANSDFTPDTIIALSTGGFPVAAALAKRLQVSSKNVVGIPVYKDTAGDYRLDESLVSLGDCTGRSVLIVDEASNRGLLTQKAVTAVAERGGIAKSCVLIANESGVQPDFVAETCPGKPPKFYWEPTE